MEPLPQSRAREARNKKRVRRRKDAFDFFWNAFAGMASDPNVLRLRELDSPGYGSLAVRASNASFGTIGSRREQATSALTDNSKLSPWRGGALAIVNSEGSNRGSGPSHSFYSLNTNPAQTRNSVRRLRGGSLPRIHRQPFQLMQHDCTAGMTFSDNAMFQFDDIVMSRLSKMGTR